MGVQMSAAEPFHGAGAPAFGGSAAAELVNEAARVGVQMSAAREVRDPASARGEVRPEGRVRARAVAPTLGDSIRGGLQRGARSARRRANAVAADKSRGTRRGGRKEPDT